MLLKLVILISYFVLVFIGVRVFELCLTACAGLTSLRAMCDAVHKYYFSAWESPLENDIAEQGNSYHNILDHEAKDVPVSPEFNAIDVNVEDEDIFANYETFKERVEDTKACVWIVSVHFRPYKEPLLMGKSWKYLKSKMSLYGIRTAAYNCAVDRGFCTKHNLISPALILIVPKGSRPKGSVKVHVYSQSNCLEQTASCIHDVWTWIEDKLSLKVKRLDSYKEVVSWTSNLSPPALSVIYETESDVLPLIFLSLSVKFTGRINFFHLRSHAGVNSDRVIAANSMFTYSYGDHHGESFSYSCMDLFLKSLHPELNDVFIVSVVLFNMACWLELFVCRGGPLKRICCSLWAFALTNLILMFSWLPIIQLLHMPEVQPIIKLCLQSLQLVMLSKMGALVRQDLLQLSEHFPLMFLGFVFYGLFLGFMKCRLTRRNPNQPFSLSRLIQDDIQEFRDVINQFFTSLSPSLQIYIFEEGIERVLRRLAMPDLWLHQAEFASSLPIWKYCTKISDNPMLEEDPLTMASSVSDGDGVCSDIEPCSCHAGFIPLQIVLSRKCSICLEGYVCGDNVKSAPCGHFFHQNCIELWLMSGNESKNKKCPVCRWPVAVPKGANFIDIVE